MDKKTPQAAEGAKEGLTLSSAPGPTSSNTNASVFSQPAPSKPPSRVTQPIATATGAKADSSVAKPKKNRRSLVAERKKLWEQKVQEES